MGSLGSDPGPNRRRLEGQRGGRAAGQETLAPMRCF